MTTEPTTTDTAADKGTTREGNPRQRTKFDVPSTWVADKTGFSRTGIYRMRTEPDTRPPSLPRMKQIQDTLDWPEADQLAAHRAGRWIAEFEAVILAAYKAEQEGK